MRKDESLRTIGQRLQATHRVFIGAVWCNVSCARISDPRTDSIPHFFDTQKSEARIVRAGGREFEKKNRLTVRFLP